MIFCGFLCFLLFFPFCVPFSAGVAAAAVTKCAAACGKRNRGKGEEGTHGGRARTKELTRMHSRRIALVCPFSSFVRSPRSYPLALVVRSFLPPFPASTLNHKYKSLRAEKVLRSPAPVFSSSVFRRPSSALVPPHRSEFGIRGKPLPAHTISTDVPAKSIPYDALFTRSRRQKNFRFETFSYSIFRSNNAMLSDPVCERQS